MGIFGYANVEIYFEEKTTKEEKDEFYTKLNESEELGVSNLHRNTDSFELSSGRIQNLQHQAQIVEQMCRENKHIIEASFSGWQELDLGVYYKEEE